MNSKLKHITLPEGLTTLCKYAFDHCYVLERLDLPDSLTAIDDNILPDHRGLIVTIGDSPEVLSWCEEHDVDYAIRNDASFT